MLGAIQTATTGLLEASSRFGAAAEAVSAAGTPASSATLPSATTIDLSSVARSISEAQTDFGVNAAMLKSSVEAERKVLDILA